MSGAKFVRETSDLDTWNPGIKTHARVMLFDDSYSKFERSWKKRGGAEGDLQPTRIA